MGMRKFWSAALPFSKVAYAVKVLEESLNKLIEALIINFNLNT